MFYQVLSPFSYGIDASCFNEAIKNVIKLNKEININELIITDRVRNMKATMRYYKHDGRNKVGINVYPMGKYGTYIDTNEKYNPPALVSSGIIAPVVTSISSSNPVVSSRIITPLIGPVIEVPRHL
jgi:hypothetical protein